MNLSLPVPQIFACSSVTQALEGAVSSRSVEVFGFGETHFRSRSYSTTSTLEYFARDCVPWLVKSHGVSIVGIELISADATEEIEHYLATGIMDPAAMPAIAFCVEQTGDLGVLALLEGVRFLRQDGHRVEIRGLEESFPMASEKRNRFLAGIQECVPAEILSFMDEWSERIEEGVGIINVNARSLVKEARARGEKTALYAGAHHMEAEPQEKFAYRSVVQALESDGLSPTAYLGIRLLHPHQHSFGEKKHYDHLVSRATTKGLALSGTGRQLAILLPRAI